MEKLRLIAPTMEYAEQILAYKRAFAGMLSWMHGSGGLANCDTVPQWLSLLASRAAPSEIVGEAVQAQPALPPMTQLIYLSQSDQKIVGMLGIRHTHTGLLSEFGGHVGYSICPTERRKGYATAMLREALPVCRQIGLKSILLTCGTDNEGSQRTILNNGGVYERTVWSQKHQCPVERYWIEL